MLRRTRIRSRSLNEAARLRRYEQARAVVFERANGYCEAGTPNCRGRMDQVHHRQGRDGDLIDDVDRLLGVCWSCHRYIHSNPSLSYERGWLLKRNGEANA
jgi:hypothetical protein